MSGQYLEKYELKIENLPWMESNEDQKHLEIQNFDEEARSTQSGK